MEKMYTKGLQKAFESPLMAVTTAALLGSEKTLGEFVESQHDNPVLPATLIAIAMGGMSANGVHADDARVLFQTATELYSQGDHNNG